MTALPTIEQLVPSSQTLSLAFSVAEVALADTRGEQDKALADLKTAIAAFREAAAEIQSRSVHLSVQAESVRGTPAELRKSLDVLAEAERGGLKLCSILRELLGRESFHAASRSASVFAAYQEISEFARELADDYLSLIREWRLSIISFIADRARDAGLPVIETSAEFRRMFLAATVEETEGWQETAWLLADIDNARLLDRSIRSAPRDRTDDIIAAR